MLLNIIKKNGVYEAEIELFAMNLIKVLLHNEFGEICSDL